jgi:hypothetical protein
MSEMIQLLIGELIYEKKDYMGKMLNMEEG